MTGATFFRSSLSLLVENKPFRRLLFGRVITNVGDSLYVIAAAWLVNDITGSTVYTGIAGFLFLAPRALQFLTGPFVDRADLRHLFVVTQILQGLLILSVPIAAVFDRLSLALLFVVVPSLAIINQFVYPAQDATLPRIVDEEQMVRANSLFSMSYRSIDMVARLLSGLLIAILGAVTLFYVNSATFFLAGLVFYSVSIPGRTVDSDSSQQLRRIIVEYRTELFDGFNYIGDSLLLYVTVGASMANFVIGASHALLPMFAEINGGPGVYGLLLAALSSGMLGGAVLASTIETWPFGKTSMAIFSLGFVFWIVAVYSTAVWAIAVFYALAWVPIGIYSVFSQTARQLGVPDDRIGKVTAAYNSASILAAPIGSLVGGSLGALFGVQTVLALVGVGFLGVVVLFGATKPVRVLPPPTQLSPDVMRVDTAVGEGK